MNLSQLTNSFLDFVGASGRVKKKSTIKWYESRLSVFQQWLDENGLSPFDPATYTYYFNFRKESKLKETTVFADYRVLFRFGAWLKKQGHTDIDPTAHLDRPSAPRRDRGTVKYIPSGEIKAIKDAARNIRDLALVTMFEQTGARASELVGLTWGKVNLKQRRVIVTGRFSKTRVVFFKRDGAKIMRTYRNTVPHTSDDPVFWRTDRSQPLTYWGIYQVLERLAARAGVARFNPHAFRHAFGVRLSLSGCPTVVLQDLMGHVSPATTKIYTEFNDDQLQEAYDLYA